MRRAFVAAAVMALLLGVVATTSGFRPASADRPRPSEFGVDAPEPAPFEIGTVMNSQSFR